MHVGAEGINYDHFNEDFEAAADAIGLDVTEAAKQPRPPFAIITSSTFRHINGELNAMRVYPWGSANICDIGYSDFLLLKYAQVMLVAASAATDVVIKVAFMQVFGGLAR